ncbi:hypothetical protein OVN20_01965 [Microcella daejeonensis]|uniref:glycoside hydrolase family 38 N-terminal domain-containing protein n=1 Tax=Microcella daejeonensis TaxID=2994971 RepID=UPI00226DBD8A|nr:hypothetical protein [Microcella daejeonensis]WAB84363.1 hypothetical protein OVN20_01965 [Microcella daejeonensis]
MSSSAARSPVRRSSRPRSSGRSRPVPRPRAPRWWPVVERTACHVVTHVHWDREWYRPFEAYRTRLVELVEQICRQLDSGAIASFHLDGQTITLRDVAALRPDLVDDVRRHVEAKNLTIGPWHVLADNQLVSGENLVRNLLAARRYGAAIGQLTDIGYSPDAFGHPADLPRILAGFGIDTALVWRGAPPDASEFRWRSPDGSEVYAVNQGYYEVDVLWSAEGRQERVLAFLEREDARREGGPWLLMNGADHVAPRDTTAVIDALAPLESARLEQSTLERFFTELRSTRPSPQVVEGELRHLGRAGTFLLPGTLSTRVYLKQRNAEAEALLERIVEPLLAAETMTSRSGGVEEAHRAGPDVGDASTVGHLRHAWELLLENAPHDSICGCSVDEVHRENEVRFERVMQLGDQLVQRALQRRGFDSRVHGAPATSETRVVVYGPIAAAGRRTPVTVDIAIAPDRTAVSLTAPDGSEVPFEVDDLGVAMSFEADLDLLPDSVRARSQRLRFLSDVEPGGFVVYTVLLSEGRREDVDTEEMAIESRIEISERFHVRVGDDASITVMDVAGGVEHRGLARLVDGGDRGDTYTFDPPAQDRLVNAVATSTVEVTRTAVRTIARWRGRLDTPAALDETRDSRSDATMPTDVAFELVHWHGGDELDWSATLLNASRDHRLRAHFPIVGHVDRWRSGQHFSSLDRPFGAELGVLPTTSNHEAAIGTHPAHGYAAAGELALLLDHVTEVQGIERRDESDRCEGDHVELAITLLRSTGWLSRFDLRTRTTGAGPMLETPEAQVLRPLQARVGLRFGAVASDAFALADAADARRAGAVSRQLREGTELSTTTRAPELSVRDAIVTAWKPAEDGGGSVLRLANPSPEPRVATVRVDRSIEATTVRFDETAVSADLIRTDHDTDAMIEVPLAPHSTASVRLRPPSAGSRE